MKTLSAWIRKAIWKTGIKERAAGFFHLRYSHSQFAEDVFLEAYYADLACIRKERVERGLFVDVGAHRPIVLSNSYTFYKRGWKCINVDATPGTMELFQKVRPKDINLELAIGFNDEEAIFYVFGEPSVFNTLDREKAEAVQRDHGMAPPRQVRIPVCRLDTILREHADGLPFEVLNIDAEGFDIEVLQSNDFDKYSPRIILCEIHGATAETLTTNPTALFLKEKGYVVNSWLNPTVAFIRSDSVLR